MRRKMKPFRTMLIKEFKALSRLYLIPLIILVCGFLYMSYQTFNIQTFEELMDFNRTFFRIFVPLSKLLRFSVPGLFIYALTLEIKTGTRYQLLSLPIRRDESVICKFLVALMYGLILSGVAAFSSFLYVKKFHAMRSLDFTSGDIYFFAVLFRNFTNLFLVLSLACLIWGIISLIRRIPLFIGLSSFFIGYMFVFWLGRKIMPLFKIIEPERNAALSYNVRLFMDYSQFHNNIYYICIGLILTAAGLVLYNKFAEV